MVYVGHTASVTEGLTMSPFGLDNWEGFPDLASHSKNKAEA